MPIITLPSTLLTRRDKGNVKAMNSLYTGTEDNTNQRMLPPLPWCTCMCESKGSFNFFGHFFKMNKVSRPVQLS